MRGKMDEEDREDIEIEDLQVLHGNNICDRDRHFDGDDYPGHSRTEALSAPVVQGHQTAGPQSLCIGRDPGASTAAAGTLE